MKIIRGSDFREYDNRSAVTVGTFDGVHLGHRRIFEKLSEIKSQKNLRGVVITFEPHPQIVLKNKHKDIKILSMLDEKLSAFEKLGVDIVWILDFTKEFSEISACDFYQKFLIEKAGLTDIVLGYDHMVGKNREGGIQALRSLSEKFDFGIHQINEFKFNGYTVSSTTIRKLLSESKVKEANELLSSQYTLCGEVIYGDKLGRKIGFPTANIKPDSEYKLIPGNGVYLVKVEIDGNRFFGLMNIGYRPTVTDISKVTIEVYIMNFDSDIYGKKINIKFIDFIREEKKFNSVEELKKQIEKDKINSINLIKNLKK